jgi:hypothetical protein
MKRRFICSLACAAIALLLEMQAEIIYTNGPSFEIPLMGSSRSLDINNDGTPDFVFRSEAPLSTFNVPSSGSSWPFHLDAAGTNQFLLSAYALVQASGTLISSNAPTGAKWSDAGASAPLTVHWMRKNGETASDGWNGSLGELKDGYLGVRFYAADGLHYGWIRVRLPKPASNTNGVSLPLSPFVADWAYETKTDSPIQTGGVKE